MSTWRTVIGRGGAALVGVTLLAGAATFLVGDASFAREHVVRSVGGGLPVAPGVIAGLVCAAEIVLGVRLLWSPGRAERAAAAALLCAFTVVLVQRGLSEGWGVHCGCLSALFEGSVAFGVVRNLVLLALLGFGARGRRDAATPPETSRRQLRLHAASVRGSS